MPMTAFSRLLALARDLFVAKLRGRHRRMMLSYVWLFAPSLIFMTVFITIRAQQVLTLGDFHLPYGVYVLTGMVLWQSVTEAMAMPIGQLAAHRQFLFRAAVPHEVVLIAGLFEALFNAAIRLVLLLLVALIAGMTPSPAWALVPFAGIALILLGLGIGLCLAPYGLLFEDVGRALALFSSALLLVTPIVYTLPPDSLLHYNPMVPALEAARAWLAGNAAPALLALAVQIVAALALIGIGWAQYRVARPHLAARLG